MIDDIRGKFWNMPDPEIGVGIWVIPKAKISLRKKLMTTPTLH